MNREKFEEFCANEEIPLLTVASDSKNIEGAMHCAAFIESDIDYAKLKSLLPHVRFTLAVPKNSNFGWGDFENDTQNGSSMDTSSQGQNSMDFENGVIYYSSHQISTRDQALHESPRLNGETEEDHLQRVEELKEQYFPPLYARSPGYYDDLTEVLVHADTDEETEEERVLKIEKLMGGSLPSFSIRKHCSLNEEIVLIGALSEEIVLIGALSEDLGRFPEIGGDRYLVAILEEDA
jgi:hypothetical protein